ncbi:nuclear transport factor 2 family protein [Nostoc sp. CCY0012]|uniref:nuclear transport factor 2 family protein n=1 Tax=Nostoc sp. CCY0012 TaxID=1056123 RepID=UPI0039C687CD
MVRICRGLLLWLLYLTVTFNTPAFAQQFMNPQDIRLLIEQARDAWVTQNADAIAQMFTDDGELILPGQRWQGKQRIREELSDFSQQYSDVKIDIHRMIIQDDQAAVEWYYEDTEKATGHRNKADDVIVVDFQDGLISRWREYFDTQTPLTR